MNSAVFLVIGLVCGALGYAAINRAFPGLLYRSPDSNSISDQVKLRDLQTLVNQFALSVFVEAISGVADAAVVADKEYNETHALAAVQALSQDARKSRFTLYAVRDILKARGVSDAEILAALRREINAHFGILATKDTKNEHPESN